MIFIHTADWQLGKPFARISHPDKAARVRSERIAAIKRIGTIAKEKQAEFVLVAGDVFDSFTADKSTVSAACSAIGEIGIPVVAIPGNHDHGGPGCLWEQDFFKKECESLAPNFQILLEHRPLELDSAVIFPCPLLRRHESVDPTEWLRSLDFEELKIDTDKPRIVLAHGSVHGFDSSGSDDEDGALGSPNLIALDRLPASEFDFIALGDWHGTKEINPDAWYAGTPEIDRFPKGENNDPGNALCVTVTRNGTPAVEKMATGKLGWHVINFEFASDEDVSRLQETLTARIGSRAGEDLVHLTVNGSLGIGAATQLDELLDQWRSRLLRLKEKNYIRLAPSDDEIEALTTRTGDPLIANVALGLMPDTEGESDAAEVARIALRELYGAINP